MGIPLLYAKLYSMNLGNMNCQKKALHLSNLNYKKTESAKTLCFSDLKYSIDNASSYSCH